jgi:hypothetical protein
MAGCEARLSHTAREKRTGRAVDRVANEVCQVAFGQPVLQGMRQQHLLMGIVWKIARRHVTSLSGTPFR